jgi:hypothetical protein
MSRYKQSRDRGFLIPALMVVAVLAGCDGGGNALTSPPDTPQPGVLTLRVTGGTTPAYGYLVDVSGPGITAVQSVGNGEVFSSLSGTALTAAIVLRTAGDGRILGIEVPDVNRVDAYSAVVRQVTDSQNEPLDPSAYRANLER